LVEDLRSLWDAASGAEPARRAALHGKIVQAIDRLKKQVGGQLPDEHGVAAYPLFGGTPSGKVTAPVGDRSLAARPARFPGEPLLRLYDKDLADQALATLPQAIRFRDVASYREHLGRTIPFNAASTRHRAANYLIGRYFPCGIIHDDLARFTFASEGRPWLGDVLFYLTCRVEKIVATVADEVVWPSLADGGVGRARITDFVGGQVPDWSPHSVRDVGAAIVRTYERFGIGSATKTRLNLGSRKGDLVSFAYVLHLELPDPGMYSFERLFRGPMRRWLLWDPEWLVEQVYACQEAGLIAKVSEIDGTRQFTTKYDLDNAVGPILGLIR
jgi:hypothetical protein